MEIQQKTLYVVATPIGNCEDITLRALTVLKGVSVVACEDTRHSKILFVRHGISTPCQSFHQHSPDKTVAMLLSRLENGDSVALVSDAGTPCISDPGWKLVHACREQEIAVEVIPGPDAVTAALSVSGIPLSGYSFLGFVPHKKGRQTFLAGVCEIENVVVFFESPYRILKTLQWLNEKQFRGTVIIARELTKIHEEVVRGTIKEVYENFLNRKKIQGEFVVVVDRRVMEYSS